MRHLRTKKRKRNETKGTAFRFNHDHWDWDQDGLDCCLLKGIDKERERDQIKINVFIMIETESKHHCFSIYLSIYLLSLAGSARWWLAVWQNLARHFDLNIIIF